VTFVIAASSVYHSKLCDHLQDVVPIRVAAGSYLDVCKRISIVSVSLEIVCCGAFDCSNNVGSQEHTLGLSAHCQQLIC